MPRFNESARQGRLIIKFLGAGNYVAMADVIDANTALISVLSNKVTIETFLHPKKVFYIDDSNLVALAFTSFRALLFTLKGGYHEAINLETESNFSKLLVCIARSDLTLGITNINKSFLDQITYDRYLVNPVMVSKPDSIKLLSNFQLMSNPHILGVIQSSQKLFLDSVRFPNGISTILLAPSGSDTNTLRRLNASVWEKIVERILSNFPNASIQLIFPNDCDWQYRELTSLLRGCKSITVQIGNYSEYLEQVKNTDLVVCIDSQTLHIATQFNIPVIAFFGPSSPYGVNYDKNIYPISQAPMCSPCVHKYFTTPCSDRAFCMDFEDSEIDIFDRLRTLCA
ncbi:glycosyltransferase family 9 protein [Polynucleobacter sp. UB-Raua-W9]|uniref:glycosyltransferase family 9 protein n=1 Tax=Polynucleobacter sp. UB-Raua-W9 TaxID=1819736 RepID=UPI001BFD3830|nr:glycosyltransferase family 9 protein [Polynucleobacter sp. UB-Raua-W9]QWD72711.1 hypothetical protein AOC07_01620 [Polynucleobacter sp. UB-Raua-W9]